MGMAEALRCTMEFVHKIQSAQHPNALHALEKKSILFVPHPSRRAPSPYGGSKSSSSFPLQKQVREYHSSYPKKGTKPMSTGTVTLHRVFKAPPERVYKAFIDPDAQVKWLPPYGFTCTVHEMDVRVGGIYRMSFTNFSAGKAHSFGGTYLEIVPNERIAYSDMFDDPNVPGVMHTVVSLKPVSCGTELHIVQEGIPDMIPVEMCYLGWQESLAQLALLVEPEIPG